MDITKISEVNDFLCQQITNNLDKISVYNDITPEKNYLNGMLFFIKTSGFSGGNCYGGSASSFTVENEERIESLVSEISDAFSQILNTKDPIINAKIEQLSSSYIYNSVYTHSEYEYYGNSNEYSVIEIPFKDIVDMFFAEYSTTLLSNIKIAQTNEINNIEKRKNQKRYNELTNIIDKYDDFHIDKVSQIKKSIDSLEDSIQKQQEKIVTLKKQQSKIESEKNKTLQKIIFEKTELLHRHPEFAETPNNKKQNKPK